MTYAKGRYYDMELALFSQVDPPLTNGTYMGRKPGENSVWTKAGANLNGYWYVMGSPVVYTDPSGEEPKWGQLGSINDIKSEINLTMIICKYEIVRDREGYFSNASASDLISTKLQKLSDHFEGNIFYTRNEEGTLIEDPNKGRSVDRYLYTEGAGWIDMHHFFRTALWAKEYDGVAAIMMGILAEELQGFQGKPSEYSYEDLPSNILGVMFWKDYGDKLESGELSIMDAFTEFIRQFNPLDPTEAPNYDFIPHIITNNYLRNEEITPLTGNRLWMLHGAVYNKFDEATKKKIQEAHKTLHD